jgi:hypothetical protein
MKVLGLDISTKAGWALREDSQPPVFGQIELEKTVHEYGKYPWSYVDAAAEMSELLYKKVVRSQADVVVIEETNLGRSRYAQKILEFTHCKLLQQIYGREVIYLSSSAWRQALGLVMSKEDKKANAKLSKAKKVAAEFGVKLDKVALGIRGKVNKKHLAIRYVNATYGLNLKVKQNDAADAICLVDAYLKGAVHADGVM